jgi:hypothetical protein
VELIILAFLSSYFLCSVNQILVLYKVTDFVIVLVLSYKSKAMYSSAK